MERRDHMRFKVMDGSFAVLRSKPAIACQMNNECMENTEQANLSTKLAKIIDISGDGLAFYHFESQDRPIDIAKLDLIFANDGYYLNNILIEKVVDFSIDPKICLSSFTIKRCGVQFIQLNLNQITSLNYFLKNYTTHEATVDPCSVPMADLSLPAACQTGYLPQN